MQTVSKYKPSTDTVLKISPISNVELTAKSGTHGAQPPNEIIKHI
jgi:hypothetical protein